jgi:nitrate reductase alpha subunit
MHGSLLYLSLLLYRINYVLSHKKNKIYATYIDYYPMYTWLRGTAYIVYYKGHAAEGF